MTHTQNPLSRHCPRLGGLVDFTYCLRCELEQPCFKVVDCWWETFDIVQFLKDHLSEDQFTRLVNARPKAKISSLLEVVEKAKQGIQD